MCPRHGREEEEMRTIPLILIGCGRVGNALRGHLEAHNRKHGNLKFTIAAVVRSDRIELGDGRVMRRTASDAWESVLGAVHEMARSEPIIVAVTDARPSLLHRSLVAAG